ncbi:MAG TPA: Fe-S cluster assembly protein SufD [Acidobacteriaceae bacterium]|nr:Fe-S cluster assembly protein SufD [Acidobacteriaceae bacterium]
MSATIQIAGLSSYLEAFSALQQRASRQPEWLRRLRDDAFARFCDVGFPTTKDEDWRFTNVAPISQAEFHLAAETASVPGIAEVRPFFLSGAACHLVFVNGRYAPELSDTPQLPRGVEADSLAAAILRVPQALEAHLGRYLNIERDAFCALNTAFIEDGAYVRVSKGAVLKAPLHVLFVSTSAASAVPRMVNPRNLLIVEENAQVSIVQEHISLGDDVLFSNGATELIAGENSVVSHLMIERENNRAFHISTQRIQQARSANVHSHSVLVGGALVRNNVHPVLAGEGAECLINGLFLGNGKQHMDNYMLVEHASPHCASHQFYNGILGGHAHGVFHGRILVHKDAQKTDAKQTNRNLLLSDDARIDTKPQLEIFADDVKCTHGATIGQIEGNALFYLRSRGLDEKEAREMLLLAFAGECMVRIPEGPVRSHVEAIVGESMLQMTASIGAGSQA